VELLSQEAKDKLSVIDSGFGFEPQEEIIARTMPVIGYLGTVNFVKMHKGFFEAIDHLEHNAKAIIYGAIDPVVQDYAKTMNNSHRFEFRGETATPDAAFAEMDIFFYPLQPEHYGTGENALVEAMSTGLPVVVLHNPAEMEIVSHRKTGLVADSIYNCNMWLDKLIRSRELRKTIGYNAAIYAATMKTPKRAAISFMRLWESMLKEAPKRVNFSEAIGQTPAEWFLATQRLPGMVYEPGQQEATATKGSLAHFQKVFKNDASFAALG
jgi:glycosyltransferase involved in cell wall biosynthesis